ncbi:MAG: hypothetical protein EBZ48_07470 [Proteobacteria bacterium]|nr:hypothetical protein [Pseudomonadota bacterium]
MSNHLHLLFVAKDAECGAQFYAELMKKITDYYKRLLGLPYLELWEPGGPVVSRVLDIDKACERVAYIYANPSRADLVDSITQYPGFSTWSGFHSAPLEECYTETIPWIRQPTISKLPTRTLTQRQDRLLAEELARAAKTRHDLKVYPNAMFRVFGISDSVEIQRYNQRIFDDIMAREEKFAAKRAKEGKKAVGPAVLLMEQIMKPHTPMRDPSDRKILFHSSCKELAFSFLEQLDAFCAKCREVYVAWRAGDYRVEWPPGAFRPPLRPAANALT